MRWLISLLLLTACSKKENLTHFRSCKMTIPYHVQVGDKLNYRKKLGLQRVIDEAFEMIDVTFNHFNPDSELSQINRLGVGEKLAISMEMERGLLIAKECFEMSHGRYNPLLGRAINAWKEALVLGEAPGDFELRSFDDLKITHEIQKFRELEIDLDGMIKGYFIDRLDESFSELGLGSYYINWGGEVKALGEHPEGRPWMVLIEHLGKAVPIKNFAIASSSFHLQYGEIDGRIYSHIIDSKEVKARPLDENIPHAIAVMAPSCAVADAIATAALSFYDKEQMQIWKSTLK